MGGMGIELAIFWLAWWGGATLLTLGLIVLNAQRRRRLNRSGKELLPVGLPTWRDDVLWGVLVVVAGAVGTVANLFLLEGDHTARGILSSAIFGMMMLLGLLMLLKNGLAPTDVLRLDVMPESRDTSLLEAPDAERSL